MDNTSLVDLLMDRNKCLRLSPLMTFDWSNGIVKVQHYAKTNLHNDSCKLKIIMTFKIYMNNDKIPQTMDNTSMVDLLIDRNKCMCLSPLSSCKNTIYYFIVCKMGMPHYNLKYSYWKRCSISRPVPIYNNGRLSL
jgi:hypothetical protein